MGWRFQPTFDPTEIMTLQPVESQSKSDGVKENPSCAIRNQGDSAAVPDDSCAGDGKDGSGGTADGDPPANTTTNENTNATPSKENTKKTKTPKSEKIKVHLVAVGSAPILKKSKFLMNADDRFAVAIAFLRKVLKLSPGGTPSAGTPSAAGSLFLYVNAAFVPAPDERVGDLFDCFGTRGELVVHYSLQEAWG